jgi:hypothetical protein
MTGPSPRIAFLTVTDRAFFPGTVATVNSVLLFHPDAELIVIDNLTNALSGPQRDLLERGGVTVVPSDRFRAEGRHLGPWELKTYAACDLAPAYDLIIGIDSDCVLCADIGEEMRHALQTGKFLGGRDGDGVTYDASYAVYGIRPGSFNPSYMSTSLYFCPTKTENRAVLRRCAECTNAAQYNGRGPYPGHGDQGLLNAVLFSARGPHAVELLDNALWSQHWRYWDDRIIFDGGCFLNTAAHGCKQRSFHCGGAEKFWEEAHVRRVRSRNPCQALNYTWWLYLLWFGRCRDASIDPDAYLPGPSRHLPRDLVDFFGPMRKFQRGLKLWRPDASGLFRRLLDGLQGPPDGGELEDYVEIVRSLPEGARVVEVGAGEGRWAVGIALGCLDRDVTIYAVEGFIDSPDGNRPSLDRFIENLRHRHPFLPIVPVVERSEHAWALFRPGSLDAVFVGARAGEDLRRVVESWRTRVRQGGLLLGLGGMHDAAWPVIEPLFPPGRVRRSQRSGLWLASVD